MLFVNEGGYVVKRMKKMVVVALAIIVVLADLYIMFNQLGVIDYLDFGAGAYYYTDIPDFQKYILDVSLRNENKDILYWIMFFLWGILMYFLWKCIDVLMCKHSREQKKKDC